MPGYLDESLYTINGTLYRYNGDNGTSVFVKSLDDATEKTIPIDQALKCRLAFPGHGTGLTVTRI